MKSRIAHQCAPLLVKILYDIAVLECLPNQYIYGLDYGKIFNVDKAIIGWLFFLFISFVSIRRLVFCNDNNITKLVLILFYIFYIPLNSAFYINDLPISYLLLTSAYWVIIVYLASTVFVFGSSRRVNRKNYNLMHTNVYIEDSTLIQNKLFYIVCFAVDIACIIYAYLYNGFSLTLNITDIYDVRSEFAGTTNMLTSLLFNFGGNIVIGISMFYGLKYRKYILAIVGVFAQLGIFSIARQKSNLMLIGVVLLVYFIDKFKLFHKIKGIVALGFIALVGSSLFESFVFNTTFIFNLFIRRMMYYPAWLNGLYFRFFTDNQPLLFTQDAFLVGKLGINRYNQSVLQLINQAFFYGYVPSPNAGMFAEAIMHFGWLGAFIFPIIDIVILKWILKSVDQYDNGIQLYLIITIILALISIPITSGVFWITYVMIIPLTFFVKKIQLNVGK